jgi:hypothetical protein
MNGWEALVAIVALIIIGFGLSILGKDYDK